MENGKRGNGHGRIAGYLRGRWREILISLGMTLLVFLVLQVIFGMRYEVNDDAILSNIASGAYGAASERLVYVNILLGFLWKPLYAVFPAVNWFVLVLVAVGILCFALLGYLLLRRAGWGRGVPLFAALLVLGGFDFFTRFHYVKYAGLLLATGLVLVVLHLGRWNFASWLGVGLAVLGSMLRFQQLFAVGGMAAALLLWGFFKLDKPGKQRAAGSVALLLLLAFAAFGVDTLAYSQKEEWARYVRFNQLRTEISDFRVQYGTPETLAPLGYSENDFDTIENWSFYDPEVFSQEALESIAGALPQNSLLNALKATLYTALAMLYASPVHVLLSAVLLGWLLVSDRRRGGVPLVGTLALLGTLVFYLQWRGRYPPRIDFIMCLCAVLFCACCVRPRAEEPPKTTSRWLTLAVCLLVVGALPALGESYAQAQDYWSSRPPRAAAFDEVAADTGTLHLVDTYLVDAANGYDVWRARPRGYFSNMVFVGSWLMDSPFQNDVLVAFGVQNPYRDAINRDDVLLADFYNRERKETYLREHYSPTARVELVEERLDFNLYRVVD